MVQLLWFETLLKLAGGAVLVLLPITVIRLLGLPMAGSSFWPRLLGGVLLGLSAATFIEGTIAATHGLGLAGCIVINLASAAVIGVAASLGAAAQTRRGAMLVWSLVVLLVVLSLVELAHV